MTGIRLIRGPLLDLGAAACLGKRKKDLQYTLRRCVVRSCLFQNLSNDSQQALVCSKLPLSGTFDTCGPQDWCHPAAG